MAVSFRALLDEANQHRRSLLASQTQTLKDLIRAWLPVKAAIRADTEMLLAARPSNAGLSWFVEQARLVGLELRVGTRVADFARLAGAFTRRDAFGAAAAGGEAITSLLRLAGVDVPARFTIPAEPPGLAALFASFGPEAAQRVRQAITLGATAKQTPEQIARSIVRDVGGSLPRAMTIARSEAMRSYREAQHAAMQGADRDLMGWVWTARLGPRCCGTCWAMHGRVFPLSQTLQSHPNCRCVPTPLVREMVPPTTGADLFTDLDTEDQVKVLGQAKQRAYEDGAISLSSLVGRTRSGLWGPGIRERSLAELVGDKAAAEYRRGA